MISLESVTVKVNSKYILDDITVTVKDGEFVGILGPNGAGKTTLLKVILGLVSPTEGSVSIDGLPPQDFIRRKDKKVSYLPQHSIVNWTMPLRVIDVVLIEKLKPFSIFRKHSRSDVDKAMYWLGVFGVDDVANKYIRELSGGQQQRVSIARCMFYEPSILILDEPNTAVDVVYNAKLYETLSSLKEKKGMTIIMATHDIGAVTYYVDRVMCLNVKLHCHDYAKRIDYSTLIRELYGDEMGIIVHRNRCEGCIFGRGK